MTIPKFQYIVHLLAQLFHLFRLSHLVYYYCRYYALIGLDQASGLAGGFDYMVFAPPYRCQRCSSTALWARVAPVSYTHLTTAAGGKDSIVIATMGETPTLSPYSHNATAGSYMNLLTYSTLFATDMDLNPQPELVESYENESETRWVFHLRCV